jgi:small-conductance mechanosensitive channel
MSPLENLPYDWALAGAVSILTLTLLLFLKTFLSRQLVRLARTRTFHFLGYLQEIVSATRLPFIVSVALLAGATQLELAPGQARLMQYAWMIVLISQLALWANRLIKVAVERSFEHSRQSNPAGATYLMVVGLISRIVVWSIGLLAILDNLGFNITTLMASLGIGGIAVALAVQNILGDMFSSISISLDKPFVLGDFIVIDDFMGTVEYVGMKTTRLRSLGGEQIIISNNELLKQRIRNYQRMRERRIQFEFGIAYQTPVEVVEQIPAMVKDIVSTGRSEVRFDRAHFRSYGDSALEFEVVYIVLTPDYNKYMDIQQDINLALMRRFRELGISFAHPTRVVYVASPPQESAHADDRAHVFASSGKSRPYLGNASP